MHSCFLKVACFFFAVSCFALHFVFLEYDSQVNTSFRLAFNLCFVWRPTVCTLPSTCTACVDLRWFWSSSNSYTSWRKFFTRLGYPTQVDTSWSQVNCISAWNLRLFATCVDLRVDLWIRLGHTSQVRKQVLVLQTCVNYFVRALCMRCQF